MKIHGVVLIGICVSIVVILFWYPFGDGEDEITDKVRVNTEICVEHDSLDLGQMKYHEHREIIFALVNCGKNPLLVKDVQTSCGCTKAKWRKRPVSPGDSAEISIVFESNSLGRFMKSIDVVCNIPQRAYSLKIRGEVVE